MYLYKQHAQGPGMRTRTKQVEEHEHSSDILYWLSYLDEFSPLTKITEGLVNMGKIYKNNMKSSWTF